MDSLYIGIYFLVFSSDKKQKTGVGLELWRDVLTGFFFFFFIGGGARGKNFRLVIHPTL